MKRIVMLTMISCLIGATACNNDDKQPETVNQKGNGDTAAGGTPMSVIDSTTAVLPAVTDSLKK